MLNQIIYLIREWYIVYPANIIALFDEEISIVEYIGKESVSFDIELEDTLHIHEFDIIDKEE